MLSVMAESHPHAEINETVHLTFRAMNQKILAMVQRKRTDCRPDFQSAIACPQWEIPIVEFHMER